MARERNPKAQQMRARIAAAAARMMAEDGIDDFALAKRKAARMLGAADTHSMPGNEEIEQALRTYQTLYQGDEQQERTTALRATALHIMQELDAYRPYLTGAVLTGTAGRYAEIDLLVFTDDSKGIELFLINRGISAETRERRYFCGDEARSAPMLRFEWHGTIISLAVLQRNDERSVLKTTSGGRALERANIPAVSALLATPAAPDCTLYKAAEV